MWVNTEYYTSHRKIQSYELVQLYTYLIYNIVD